MSAFLLHPAGLAQQYVSILSLRDSPEYAGPLLVQIHEGRHDGELVDIVAKAPGASSISGGSIPGGRRGK